MSEKPAFTPGPWQFRLVQWSPRRDEYEIVAGSEEIALVNSTDGADEPTHYPVEANAALISAAPDMFEALTIMVNHYVKLADSGDAGFWKPEEEDEVKIARAALSKALGKDAP